MVTHDPFATSYCNRVIFIKDGELYNELHRGLYREKFYQEILDVLALLGKTWMTFWQFAFKNVSRNSSIFRLLCK